MFLDLGRVRTPQDHIERTYPPDAFGSSSTGAPDDFRVTGPVVLAFDITKSGGVFTLDGRVRAPLELACVRCLEPVAHDVDAAFDLRYQPQSSNTGAGEREIHEDDLATAFYADDTIDLGQLMREQFYLALPMKPLCTEDCRGLCSVCGTNLNRGTCTCVREWEDPRLAALKTLARDPQTRH